MLFSPQRPSALQIKIIVGSVFLFSTVFLVFHSSSASQLGNLRLKKPSKGALIGDVFNSTLGFEKIFAISLPARTDHRDALLLASTLTNIKIDLIDGVKGDAVLDKVLPPQARGGKFPSANVGSWRAHMNAIAAVVEQNLTSALILEDDADWDVRIKQQLYDYALSSQALIQPLSSDPSSYADPTFPAPQGPSDMAPDLQFGNLAPTVAPKVSPYGDGWDILWLGHCGMNMPSIRDASIKESSLKQPKGRVVHLNDETVPEIKKLYALDAQEDLRRSYPDHTRVTHHVAGAICSLGYAVSQAGARRLLYDLGLKTFDKPFDLMLRSFCQGTNAHDYHLCLTVQPQLFEHHRPKGRTSQDSDITDHGDEVRDFAFTLNIRYSTMLNLDKLLKGDTQYNDQFPDSPPEQSAPSP